MSKSPYTRAQQVAVNSLAELARGTSMTKVKIALRDVLRREKDLGDTFAPLFEQKHLTPFEAILRHIAGTAKLPDRLRAKQNRKPVTTDEKIVAALVKIIRDRFDYDPETGALTRKRTAYRVPAGTPVGHDNGKGTLQVVVAGRRFAASYVCWLHYYGRSPDGQVRMRKGCGSLAIKDLYVLPDSR